MQRVARDQLFPHSGKEGKEGKEGSHENRAGEKLEELAQAVGLLDGMQPGVVGARFLDLCGGPGAWSQYLLQMNFQGFGFTLRSGAGSEDDWQAEQKDDWYPELLRHPNWHAIWGADGTGDLLKPENLQHASQILRAPVVCPFVWLMVASVTRPSLQTFWSSTSFASSWQRY